MKILLTGAFGNVGMSTLYELLRQGHQVRCFVTPRKAHERTSRQFAGKIELIQGDIRRPADLSAEESNSSTAFLPVDHRWPNIETQRTYQQPPPLLQQF